MAGRLEDGGTGDMLDDVDQVVEVEPVELPTADVAVGDLLLVRPGAKIPVDGVVEDGESEVDEPAPSMLMNASDRHHKPAVPDLVPVERCVTRPRE